MGKFIDTTYQNTIDGLVQATKSKINNPYYKFTDQKPTKVTYWSQSLEMSTLDKASGLYGAHLGKDSPFIFSKIEDMYLFGLDKISTEYDVTDYGTESNSITGDAIVLPNTIVPRPGDFFAIPYVKEDILFKVNSVSPDTLDGGATIYKLEYALELTNSIAQIESQTNKVYKMLINNVGTDFKAIIQDSDYELIEKLEILIGQLIIYFRDIFFDTRLQTFVFNHNGFNLYDPYLIEFLIKNKVLDYGGEYVYVSHACYTEKTFGMNYLKTFFRYLEDQSINNFSTIATAELIQDQNSLFITRTQNYYQIKYIDNDAYKTRFFTIDPDVLNRIKNGEKYSIYDDKVFYNLWIDYFNDRDNLLNGDIIDKIIKIDYMNNIEYFYSLPITVYMLEMYIKNLLKK